jgi:hypothetical protein
MTAPPAAISVTHSAAADEESMKYSPLPDWLVLQPASRMSIYLRRPANLLQIAQSFLFDGGQTAFDIAFGGLAVGEIIGLVRKDHFILIRLPHRVPALRQLLH